MYTNSKISAYPALIFFLALSLLGNEMTFAQVLQRTAICSKPINLDGKWQYAITPKDGPNPTEFDGEIKVPFPLESQLSGVTKPLKPGQSIWYKRSFALTPSKKHKTLLHFGAVDQNCTVLVNGRTAGTHSGGYDPFSFDITSLVKKGPNELIVQVTDDTEKGDRPHGKQSSNPKWTRYTSVTGIWQTVWLEQLPKDYIQNLFITPDLDQQNVTITVQSTSQQSVKISLNEKIYTGKANTKITIPVPNPKPWSPESPYLYHFTVSLGKDQVRSYFGMRKIEVKKDDRGTERIHLNNKPYFSLGTLDQGYYPQGLYTASSDKELKKDILLAKAMGFNTIRKHLKIEPERWYFLCDSIGILVWQDMPSWRGFREIPETYKANFLSESSRHIRNLYNHPAIIMWCVFNEDWGAFDQQKVMDTLRPLDSTRLWNANSGSFKEDYSGSDLTDRHMYPDPTLPPYEKGKAMVCSEYGGIYQHTPGHEWIKGKGWGHASPPGSILTQRYSQMVRHLETLKEEGLSGAIYTQAYDLETEENGLMTYDRKTMKIPIDTLKTLNWRLTRDNR